MKFGHDSGHGAVFRVERCVSTAALSTSLPFSCFYFRVGHAMQTNGAHSDVEIPKSQVCYSALESESVGLGHGGVTLVVPCCTYPPPRETVTSMFF